MKQILKISLVISLLFLGKLQAQTDAEKAQNKEMEKTLGLSEAVEPSEEYKKAYFLVYEAVKKLKEGEVNEADKIIRQSIDSYPTLDVIAYLREICAMSDFQRAKTIMDILYAKLVSMPDSKLFVIDNQPVDLLNGKRVQKVRLEDKKRVQFRVTIHIGEFYKQYGSVPDYIYWIKTGLAIDFKMDKKVLVDMDKFFKMTNPIALAGLEKDYDKAIGLIKALDLTNYPNMYPKNASLVSYYIAKEDYQMAKKINEEDKNNPYFYNKSLFKINALLGNKEAALHNFEECKKYMETTNDFYYYLAVIDVSKKDNDEALKHLDEALNNRSNGMFKGQELHYINKHEVYKAMGDAYAGLKQYEKARDAYNLSLLFYPDYEPAQKALAKLESVVATTTATDKTPPTITVTEPANTRGLEVIAKSNDILVKGSAQDPSGLKSVTINGQAVYAQASGDFWGNINLKEGANQITIVATDGAGNSGTQTFTIQRKAAAVDKGIVLATKKEGKNYCLLIGAQNYNDLSIPSLENPIQDAIRLKLILKKDYSFDESNIISLFNPTANDIKRQLLELSTSIAPEDNLVIFYAGHGTWAEKEKKGYWLLVDAKRNDPNTWLPNKDVLTLIAKLPSRHTLLITDACFSGGVFKTRSLGKDAPLAMQTMNEKISRVAITSGNDTEVPDESVFMKYLIKALTDNKEKYLTAQKMFITQIMEAVMTETKTEPRYGTLELAGHVGGDYIFAKK